MPSMTDQDRAPVVRQIPRAVATARVSALPDGTVRGRMVWRVNRENRLVGPFVALGEPFLVADPLGMDVPQLFVELTDVASFWAQELQGVAVDGGARFVANASHCVTFDL